MVDTKLEPRLGVILETRSVMGSSLKGSNSYWSNPIAAKQLGEKTRPFSLNQTDRDNPTTYSLREAIYRANKNQ